MKVFTVIFKDPDIIAYSSQKTEVIADKWQIVRLGSGEEMRVTLQFLDTNGDVNSYFDYYSVIGVICNERKSVTITTDYEKGETDEEV